MLVQVLIVEILKLRRTKIVWLSWLAFSLMPIIAGAFMWIINEPERAEQFGLLGQKAQFAAATADWPNYLNLLLQTTGVGGMILVSVITAYVFGREYSEGTMKDLLALPVGRHWVVVGKLAVVFLWFGALMVSLIAEALFIGWLLGLSNFSIALLTGSVGDILLAALVAWMLIPAVTWVATLGQGYLAPLGFTIFMLVLGNVLGATGWGKWFPWSIVPLYAGVAGPRVEALADGSLVVLTLTFVAAFGATVWRLRYADFTSP